MKLYIYYGVVLGLIALSFLYFKNFKFRRKKSSKKPLRFFALLILISNAVWSFPLYYMQRTSMEPWGRFFNSVAHSTYHSAVLFGLEGDLSEVSTLKGLLLSRGVADVFAVSVAFVATLYYFLAPLITVSAIISLFREYFSYLEYKFLKFFRHKVYVFSELNERSITLAQSIIESEKNDKKPVIVFCDVFSRNNEASYELRDTASRIGSICLKRDIATVKYLGFRSRKKVKKLFRLFLIGENESENLEQTIKLIKTFKAIDSFNKRVEKDSFTLYLFSKSSTSELSIHSLLNDKSDVNVNVIRVDYKRSMIYNYLYKHGKDIIKRASHPEKKHFEILILGMGEHGFEMVKALLWFCQRTNYTLRINVYDSKSDVESRFYEQCPGIRGENPCDSLIEFNTVDFNSDEFYKHHLIFHSDVNFVFISLRDDGNNIALAKKTREFFAR